MVIVYPGEVCKFADQCRNSETCPRSNSTSTTKLICYQFKGFDGKRPTEFNTSSKKKILHG